MRKTRDMVSGASAAGDRGDLGKSVCGNPDMSQQPKQAQTYEGRFVPTEDFLPFLDEFNSSVFY